jgi:hypothetical protein
MTAALLWFCWTTIGMGYPLFNAFLPQYLANSGGTGPAPTTYTGEDYIKLAPVRRLQN